MIHDYKGTMNLAQYLGDNPPLNKRIEESAAAISIFLRERIISYSTVYVLSKEGKFPKEGKYPEDVVTKAFDYMGVWSLGDLSRSSSSRVVFFPFHMDEAVVRSIGTVEFYKTYFRRLADFAEHVPEYAEDPNIKYAFELFRGDDFSLVYGETKYGDRGFPTINPLFENQSQFAIHLRDFLGKHFNSDSRKRRYWDEKRYPTLIPIFNFQWPEPLDEFHAQKAVEVLQSYSRKRYFDNSGGYPPRFVENGDLTPDETDMAEKNGKMIGFICDLVDSFAKPHIIAAPMYGVNAISPDSRLESWIDDNYRDYKRIKGLLSESSSSFKFYEI